MLTNEVVPPSHQPPDVYATELAVVPAVGTTAAKIYAAQQNTQMVYELAWNAATATLGPTGRFFLLDRIVIRMTAGSVANDGELDLVIYESSNVNPSDPLDPSTPFNQKLWLYTPDNAYATGTLLKDLGTQTYEAYVDLLLAPLFPGVQTVVFMGFNASNFTDIVTYRAGNPVNTTTPAFDARMFPWGWSV